MTDIMIDLVLVVVAADLLIVVVGLIATVRAERGDHS